MFGIFSGLKPSPHFDTTCPNCHRRYEHALSPDGCPFCGFGNPSDVGQRPPPHDPGFVNRKQESKNKSGGKK